MYIVAIAWLYITLLMAATEASVVAGVLTFVFYGLLPCALFLWVVGTPHRRRQQIKQALLQQQLDQQDGTDAKPDQ